MDGAPQIEEGYTRIANELLEAIFRYKFNASQLSIVLLVIRYTYGFQRKEHEFSVSFIGYHTGIHKTQIQKELAALVSAKVVIVTKEATRTESRRMKLNKKYFEWEIEERGMKTVEEKNEVMGGSKDSTSGGSNLSTTGGSKDSTHERKVLKKDKEMYVEWFEEFWKIYPKKVGKKDAIRHFKRISSQRGFNFDDYMIGTRNYIEFCRTINRSFQDGSTFVNKETYSEFLDMSQHQEEMARGGGFGKHLSAAEKSSNALNEALRKELEQGGTGRHDITHEVHREDVQQLPSGRGQNLRMGGLF